MHTSPEQLPTQGQNYRPLPSEVLQICAQAVAPPRLLAHLVLVHDVACSLSERIPEGFPGVALNWELVRFGAAIHDIGKSIHRSELTEPGKKHEEEGLALLLKSGISPERARFAYTHGNWDTAEQVTLEDLMVALADNCWKGKRLDQLESKTVNLLSQASQEPEWMCYSELDVILESLARDADERLTWQSRFNP